MKKNISICLLLLIFNVEVSAQKFPLAEIINNAYQDFPGPQNFTYSLDGLFPFFDTTAYSQHNKIQLHFYKSEQDFAKRIRSEKSITVLTIKVLQVATNSIVLNLELGETNFKLYKTARMGTIYEYINSRDIECIFQNSKWTFSRIIKNRPHPSKD